MAEPLTVLVLCTGNSARSVLGEVLLRENGFAAHSAGSTPRGAVHPEALATLRRHGHDPAGLRSKSWDEFAQGQAGAPEIDVVITVCDSAAGEACPLWHGAPVRVHWGLPDPAAVEDPDAARAAFEDTYAALKARIDAFARVAEDTRGDALAQALERIHAAS